MRIEKHGSMGEGGRSFRNIFDWNTKSRKKLISETANLSEQTNQKTSGNTDIPTIRYNPVTEDYTAGALILKDFASAVTNEDDYRKSPGLIARLMGLNSLPISNIPDTNSNRFPDTRSVTKPPESRQKDYHESDQKRVVIEIFQTEIIPPKIARSVSITQHKPLSLIKKSRFSDDFPARKPSSRKPVESNAARNLKGQSMNKSWDGCLEQKSVPENRKKPVLENGKKSVSLAIQAKVNVKKREGLSSNGTELIIGEQNNRKGMIKKPLTNNVLKQNNKKQNCLIDRRKPLAKSLVSSTDSQLKKPVSVKNSSKIPVNKPVTQRKGPNEDVKNRVLDKHGKKVVRSNGSDVVSFTFTSPMSRSSDKKTSFLGDNRYKSSLNLATGGDLLSTILDKQVRDLTLMNSAFLSQESRINRIPIFQDRNRDTTSIDQKPVVRELGALFDTESPDSVQCIESEHSYINDILSDIEPMFEDFTLNRTNKIVNPRRFDQLESRKPVSDKKNDPKLRRKLVFDCVSECVDSRCRVWSRGVLVVTRKKRLVEEVCNTILRWERMKDCMVDELVDKNMSGGQRGKWLDFDFEAFEIGLEIERQLISSLIGEAVVDILVVSTIGMI